MPPNYFIISLYYYLENSLFLQLRVTAIIYATLKFEKEHLLQLRKHKLLDPSIVFDKVNLPRETIHTQEPDGLG